MPNKDNKITINSDVLDIKTLSELSSTLRSLSPGQCKALCEVLIAKKLLLTIIKKPEDLNSLLTELTPPQCKAICEVLIVKEQPQNIIKNVSDLKVLLEKLTPWECGAVFEALTSNNQLLEIVKNSSELSSIFKNLNLVLPKRHNYKHSPIYLMIETFERTLLQEFLKNVLGCYGYSHLFLIPSEIEKIEENLDSFSQFLYKTSELKKQQARQANNIPSSATFFGSTAKKAEESNDNLNQTSKVDKEATCFDELRLK